MYDGREGETNYHVFILPLDFFNLLHRQNPDLLNKVSDLNFSVASKLTLFSRVCTSSASLALQSYYHMLSWLELDK